jgi:hypothetical protein
VLDACAVEVHLDGAGRRRRRPGIVERCVQGFRIKLRKRMSDKSRKMNVYISVYVMSQILL